MNLVRSKAFVPGLLLLTLAFASCVSSPEVKSARFLDAGKKLLAKNDAPRALLQFQNAVKVTPKSAEAHYQLGLALLATGDVKRGVGALRRALELDPKHTGAQLRLATIMVDVPDAEVVKDAKQRLETLLNGNPNNADVLHALALTELKLGDPKEAMQHLEQALAATPQDLVVTVTLAQAKLQQKDRKGAEEILVKACADSPKSPDCPVILGRLLAAENRVGEAEQKFRQALAMDPKHAGALLNLAMLQDATGHQPEAEQTYQRLSALSDKQFKFYHADYLFQLGKKNEALKEFERLVKDDPSDRTARTQLVAVYHALNRDGDAENTLNQALQKNRSDLDALLQRGEIYLAARKYDQAEADLNRVMHLKPEAAEVHYVMAQVQAVRGSATRQRQELNEALRLNPFLLQARVEIAQGLIAENQNQAALDLLNQAPESQKQLVPAIEQRVWAQIANQQAPDARKTVDQGLAMSHTPDLLLANAVLLMQGKRYDDARKSVREALEKNPEDLRALRMLVMTSALPGHVAAGVQDVKTYAAQHPKSAPIQYFLGTLLVQTGDNAQARQALIAAKTADPNYAPTDLALAQIDLKQGSWNSARQPLTAALAKREDPLARRWLGMLEVSVGNQPAAIADFRKAIEAQPNDAVSLNNLAMLLVETGGEPNEALKYAQSAVELVPDNPNFQDTLGLVLYRKGVYGSATNYFKAAVSKGGDVRTEFHLAMGYFKSGDAAKGRTVLQAALRKDPNVPEAKLAQEVALESSKSRP